MVGNLPEHQNGNCHDEWLSITQALISDIEQEIARNVETMKRAEERMQILEAERSHIQAAIDSYKKRHRMSTMTLTNEQRRLLQGKTVSKQARLLAHWSGGDLVMKDAVKLLSQEGFIEGEHPDSALYSAVTRDEAFERVKRGVYRFTPPEGWSEHDDSEEDKSDWNLEAEDEDGETDKGEWELPPIINEEPELEEILEPEDEEGDAGPTYLVSAQGKLFRVSNAPVNSKQL